MKQEKEKSSLDEKYIRDFVFIASRPNSVQRDELCFALIRYKGMEPKLITTPLEGKNRRMYFGKKFSEKMWKKIYNELSSEENFTKHITGYEDLKSEYEALASKIEKTPKEKHALVKAYEEFIEEISKLADYIWAPFFVESYFDEKLLVLLKERYPESAEKLYHVVTLPTELHEYQKMRLAICNSVIENIPKEKASKDLTNQYAWYGEYTYTEPLLDQAYFIGEIRRLSREEAEDEYKKITNEIESNMKEFKEILGQINDPTLKHYCMVVNKYVLLRTDRIDTMKKLQKAARHILNAVAEFLTKDTNLPWTIQSVASLTNAEIIEYLKNNILPDKNFIDSRAKNYIYIRDEKETEVITDADQMRNIFMLLTEKRSGQLIEGKVAFKGKAIGKVALVFNKEDLSKVEEGSILVARTTMVDYISAMRRAAAFVTEEGGITSHAAIVSRELKKPCIVGTKIATQVLKDGDMVEVDADNGIVRIINK